MLKTSKEIARTLATYRLLDPETLPEDKRKIGSVRKFVVTLFDYFIVI